MPNALGAVAAEVSRAIDAGEWVAAVVDDDKEEGALFGLTRTLWLATSKGLFALERATAVRRLRLRASTSFTA